MVYRILRCIIIPLPLLMTKLTAVNASPSMSLALLNNSAWVMTRTALSSSIAAKVTGLVVGASLTGLMSSVAVARTVSSLSVML